MKKFAFYIFILFLLFKIQVLTTGCANIVPPLGGPRDSLPPVLIKTVPALGTRNFTGNRITLTFDEYIEVDQNAQQNLLASPTPKIPPIVDGKLHTVTIKLKDTLEKNTTYAIDLSNAIKDVREGNMLRSFTYVFSTGNIIDSNTLSGKVLLAETGKPDSTLIAVLHTSAEDSAVAKERPRYYTKLDSGGNFHFRFIAPGTYRLYAMKDEGVKRYMSKSQLFAFADKPVVVTDNSPYETLYAYSIKEEEKKPVAPPATTSKPKRGGDRRLKFETSLKENQLDLLGSFTMSFEEPLKTFDTSKIILTDEKYTRLKDYAIKPDSTNRVYTLTYPWKESTTYQLLLDTAFAADSADRKLLKSDTLTFKTKGEYDYGSLRLRFSNIDTARKPILQLVQDQNTIVFTRRLTNKEFYTRIFRPGEYEIRILYDTNGNGVWDPGDFFGKHLQPERVLFLSKKLTVKPNWDNELTIELAN